MYLYLCEKLRQEAGVGVEEIFFFFRTPFLAHNKLASGVVTCPFVLRFAWTALTGRNFNHVLSWPWHWVVATVEWTTIGPGRLLPFEVRLTRTMSRPH